MINDDNVYETADLTQGYYLADGLYHCLYCTASFAENQVYPLDGQFYTAKGMIENHLTSVHQGPLLALLSESHEQFGISTAQLAALQLFAQDLPDKVIAQRLAVSSSTVRNHRFKLREKARQARYLLAAMALLDKPDPTLVPHAGATMIDERYQITATERAQIIQASMDQNGWIETWPRKEKRKIVLLSVLIKDFDPHKNYAEPAVNDILKQHVADYVTVRRYLIEYGFLKRTNDGKTYWVNL